jgi:hemolysin D
MKSSKVVPLASRRPQRERDELAFLPAALEIVETPPSPLGRSLALVIAAVFCAAIAWAAIGKTDIIASAPGKIVASGRSKVLQPFETGVVRAIHVRDGQPVKVGDVLVELDPTINTAESNRIRSDLMSAKLDVARLTAALDVSADPLQTFHPPADAPADLVATQREFLIKQIEEYKAKIAGLDQQQAQKAAERDTIQAEIDKLTAVGPVIEQRLTIQQSLYARELGSKIAYLQTLQQSIEQKHELAVDHNKLREAEAALAAITHSRLQAAAEYQRTIYGQLTEAERKAGGLTQDLAKAQERTNLQQLKAPINGYVQQLAIHTVGGVVTPAQELLVVVPAAGQLEIEARVSNQDIGFIKVGQTAEIKVGTFNFTRYGLLHGEVRSVSHDAIVRDKSEQASKGNSSSADQKSDQGGDQDLYYAARISLDRTSMNIDDAEVNLAPGMAVTAEIKTGSRSLLEYLLSPLLRYKHDSMRER